MALQFAFVSKLRAAFFFRNDEDILQLHVLIAKLSHLKAQAADPFHEWYELISPDPAIDCIRLI